MLEKEYYSPQEIAEKFNLKPRTVANWIRKGKLKAIKLGDLWRVHRADLEAFIKDSQEKND
ncbi:MAG TPA: helix-turn-helix domain-containing protein [Bacillota bacterium]